MKQEIVTYSQSLTQPISVSFTCEHCGTFNIFTQDIVGVGSLSVKTRKATEKYVPSVADSFAVNNLAKENLELKMKQIEKKIATDNFSWLNAAKCSKCKHFQSWNNRRIWSDFLKLFFGAPFIILLVVGFPITQIYKNTSDFPLWANVLLLSLVIIVMVGAIINLVYSLSMKSRKSHNKPTVTLLSIR